MKKIEAIIRTSKFEDVKAQLKEIGIDFFSYWDASGVGNEHQRDITVTAALFMTPNIYQGFFSHSCFVTSMFRKPSTALRKPLSQEKSEMG